jgi:Protein O-mannosyl-transferase TMEM260-like
MKRSDSAIAVVLFLASFTLYVRTLASTLLYGDSAEFQTIAYTLGVGHPTGYSIYVLLAKLFTFLPVGDIAYRVNLFSAFSAALTVTLVYLITRKLGAISAAALYGSLVLALMPLFWKHASIAEIYAPSAACLALILFFVFQWKQTSNPRWLFLAGLFGGLSLGIHTTVALSGIVILLYLLLATRRPIDWIQASLGAFVGIIIFISSFFFLDFLNVSAGYFNTAIRPSLSVWNMTPADFDSPFERLAFLFFPPQFRGQFFSVSPNEVKLRLREFAADVSWNLLLAFIGFVSLFIPRKDSPSCWRESMLLVVALLTFFTFAITYNVFDFYVYYIPAILILAIFVGLGVSAAIEVVALIPKLPHFIPVALSIVMLFLGFYPYMSDVTSYWRERIPPGLEDWEGYFYEYPEARRLEVEETVKGVEDNAIVFTDWDRAYDFYYVAHVLQGRTEMDFHETYPQEGVTQFADSAIHYIEANIESRPIYFSERPSQLASRYKITRAGSHLFRIEKK